MQLTVFVRKILGKKNCTEEVGVPNPGETAVPEIITACFEEANINLAVNTMPQ